MRKSTGLGLGALLVICAVYVGAAPMQSLKPAAGSFDSQFLDLRTGALVGERGGKPELLVQLAGIARDQVWVEVTISPPDADPCKVVAVVTPEPLTEMRCVVDNVVPDTPYAIGFDVFAEESRETLLEKSGTAMRFGKKDVAAFLAWLAPRALPKTFENVVYSPKLNLGAAMFGGMKKTGSLTVSADEVRYAQKELSVIILTADIRAVRLQKTGPRDAWVVVEYDASGVPATAAFQGSALKGSTQVGDLADVLSYVFERQNSKGLPQS